MSRKKILIVDDDEDFLAELQEVLDSSGYNTTATSDSIQAEEIARAMNFDMILMDLKMEGLNGFQLAERIKSFSGTAHIPIIAMTAFFIDDIHIPLMKTCGMGTCIKKPFNPLDVIALIEGACNKKSFIV